MEVRALGGPYILLQDPVHFLNHGALPIRYPLNGNERKRIQMKEN